MMPDVLLRLLLGNKEMTFSWRDDGEVNCDYEVPSEGPIAHSGMVMTPRDAIVYISKLLVEGWRVDEVEGDT